MKYGNIKSNAKLKSNIFTRSSISEKTFLPIVLMSFCLLNENSIIEGTNIMENGFFSKYNIKHTRTFLQIQTLYQNMFAKGKGPQSELIHGLAHLSQFFHIGNTDKQTVDEYLHYPISSFFALEATKYASPRPSRRSTKC